MRSSGVRSKSGLIKKLKELKRDLYSQNYTETIDDVINNLVDYGNNTQDWSLDDYTYKFASEDMMQDYLKHRGDTFGFSQIARDMEEVKYDDDYYLIDDTYGTVYNIDEKDVEEWIDDILSDLK